MKQLEGKSCQLEILYFGKKLFYKAIRVLEVSNTHITFVDRYGKQYSFRLIDVIEVDEVREAR